MTCFGVKDAFQHPDVNIGWIPFRTKVATKIRSIPEAGNGNLIASLQAGRGLGVQSVRNPKRLSQIPRRKAAHAADGTLWVWCYSRKDSHTGWICLDDIEPDPGNPKPLVGPAKLDFEVGRTSPGHKSPSGCGRDIRDRPRAERLRVVKKQDVYLRYSPRGTAKHYLHHGDEVLLILGRESQGFCFAEVVSAAAGSPARPGTRGWILGEALQARA